MFFYTVKCTFDGEQKEAVSARWVKWLVDEHIADVVNAGAIGADIVRMDGDDLSYEIRYRFENRSAFNSYERDHAPRLRKLGLAEFPHELGLRYERTTGEVVKAAR
ncbi:MAG: DUF4286 family protein [Planctomycetota bacterium]